MFTRRNAHHPRDDKTERLYRSACILFSIRDYEHVSMADLAHQAGISVGSIYQRYTDKDALIDSTVEISCLEMMRDAERRLEQPLWEHAPSWEIAEAVIGEMTRNLEANAGVIRAALKRGHLHRTNLKPLATYRAVLSNRAVALLAPRVKLEAGERAIRCAVQMAHATAIDALLHEAGPLRAHSEHMRRGLTSMVINVLELEHP